MLSKERVTAMLTSALKDTQNLHKKTAIQKEIDSLDSDYTNYHAFSSLEEEINTRLELLPDGIVKTRAESVRALAEQAAGYYEDNWWMKYRKYDPEL